MTMTIAIVTEEPGWHGRRLREAFATREITSRYTSLGRAAVRIERDVSVYLPGFENSLPDAVFVRGIPGGSLEQVVHHLNVLHVLSDLGVPVYNDGRAIERRGTRPDARNRRARARADVARTRAATA